MIKVDWERTDDELIELIEEAFEEEETAFNISEDELYSIINRIDDGGDTVWELEQAIEEKLKEIVENAVYEFLNKKSEAV
jgi:hypothetical protein